MRRALSIAILALTAAVAATSAAAQQPPARTQDDGHRLGLRYLSWPGRTMPTRTAMDAPSATPAERTARTSPETTSSRRVTPAVIPHGRPPEQATPPPASPPAQALTPANSWMAPGPANMPAAVAAQAIPSAPAAADPMAPRRDAPIFHMQDTEGTAPAQAPQARPRTSAVSAAPAAGPAAGPAEQGARYYSVHRQNNRQPDPTPLPPTTYVDAIAVDLPASLASQDLAAPPEPPALIRNAQGRLQAMPDTSTPDQL